MGLFVDWEDDTAVWDTWKTAIRHIQMEADYCLDLGNRLDRISSEASTKPRGPASTRTTLLRRSKHRTHCSDAKLGVTPSYELASYGPRVLIIDYWNPGDYQVTQQHFSGHWSRHMGLPSCQTSIAILGGSEG
jgi:hypothetical protein